MWLAFLIPPTMGHFKKGFYANLRFRNGTILTTIAITTIIPTRKQQQQTNTTLSPKKPSLLCLPTIEKVKGGQKNRGGMKLLLMKIRKYFTEINNFF